MPNCNYKITVNDPYGIRVGSWAAKAILLQLFREADDDGHVSYTEKEMAAELECGRSTLRKWIAVLEKKGLIQRLDVDGVVILTYIYLIRDKRSQAIKIGKSDDPVKRLAALQRQATLMPEPHDLELIDYRLAVPETEKLLHDKYRSKNVRGEWFRLTAADLEEIKEALQASECPGDVVRDQTH